MSYRMNEVESVMSEPSGAVDLTKSDSPSEPGAAGSRDGRITFQSMADRLTLGLLASVIGAVLVFVSALLTWSSIHVKSVAGTSASGGVIDSLGISGSRLGSATLVLSIAALALVGVMLLPATKPYAWKVLIGTGVLIAVLALIELFRIPATLHLTAQGCGVNGVTCSSHRSIGPGVWFTLVAGLLVAAGAYVHHIRPVGLRPEAGHVSSRPEVGHVISRPEPAPVPQTADAAETADHETVE
jgi:hypothetical protein